MNQQIKNLLVGIFILSAITLLVMVILFLKPSVGDGKQTLYVRFSDINNINVGTRVLFAGKPIGEVVTLDEIRNAREQPTDELGRVYFYQLTLHIDSKVKVYNTDEISIQTSGLLGEKSIAITPKAPPLGVVVKRITDQPIYADSVDSLQNALVEFSEVATALEEAFNQVSDWIKTHGEEVATTVRAAGAAMEEIDQAVSSFNQKQILDDIKAGIGSFNAFFDQMQTAVQQLQEKETFANAGIVMQNLKSTTASFDVIAQDIAQGKGTLGKLITNDDLYLQLNAIFTKANALMNDINHYGVLFHLNKQWQRTRLQKINELNALDTPENFREYFQNEVDDINAAMSRISMLINKAENGMDRDRILQSCQFRADFAELLRKVDELSDNLRLYNQQLHDHPGDN